MPFQPSEPGRLQGTEETEEEAVAKTGRERREADHQPLQATNQEQERLVFKESQIQNLTNRDQGLDHEVTGKAGKWSNAEKRKGKRNPIGKCSEDIIPRTIPH